MKKAVCIASGGMDSATLMYHLDNEGYALHVLGFDYGQRHAKELDAAEILATRLRAPFTRVNLKSLRTLLPGSSLTDSKVAVPHGHYAADTMKATVVPNRNAIMLAIAWGHAVAIGADVVAFGAHGGDHFIYPDCRPQFWQALNVALRVGNEGFGNPGLHLVAPFINATKADIAAMGHKLGVPFELTWSCYEGRPFHCGQCGTCVERKEAFELAGIHDPTIYED